MTALALPITPILAPSPSSRGRVCEPCQHRLARVESNHANAFGRPALYRSTRTPEPAGVLYSLARTEDTAYQGPT
jgi:hypothetical protein